jgi:hypothetical protein
MDRKEELRKIIQVARDELITIEEAESILENENIVGKCFKYRNSYSCPTQEEDYWWIYSKVIGLTDDGCLRVWHFQKDRSGEFMVNPNSLEYGMENHTEIPEIEFYEAWNNFLGDIIKIIK